MAWDRASDAEMLPFLQSLMYAGIEVVPSGITDYYRFFKDTWDNYRLEIASFNGIWQGRMENIFDMEQRNTLAILTREIIDHAAEARCKNIVFDCARNRLRPVDANMDKVNAWFKELGDYAAAKGTVLAVEACPATLGTNFINTVHESFEYVKRIGSPGLKVNADFGALLENQEDVNDIISNLALVNQVQISETQLLPIRERPEHQKLAELLKKNDFQGFVSVEMQNPGNLETVKNVARYIAGVFNI
ncbi:TIM barrel protein [Candidatus Saccharibacteria bacterium]|nr:TIM barrel protein [Candidatus Saccharibacteria bacterium]